MLDGHELRHEVVYAVPHDFIDWEAEHILDIPRCGRHNPHDLGVNDGLNHTRTLMVNKLFELFEVEEFILPVAVV